MLLCLCRKVDLYTNLCMNISLVIKEVNWPVDNDNIVVSCDWDHSGVFLMLNLKSCCQFRPFLLFSAGCMGLTVKKNAYKAWEGHITHKHVHVVNKHRYCQLAALSFLFTVVVATGSEFLFH